MFSEGALRRKIISGFAATVLVYGAFAASGSGAQHTSRTTAKPRAAEREDVPPLLLAGGRRLEFVRTISSERQVKPKPSFWSKVVDWVAGPPEYRAMVRPYGIALDSTGRMIVTDPGAPAVHILDFEKQKYDVLDPGRGREFGSPMAVAVDSQDSIYISDSQLAAVFVFNTKGKFQRVIGGGKSGLFARPLGIAVDAARRRLFVADTLRHQILLLDFSGNVIARIGSRGTATGQFNFPTGLALHGDELVVVDAMNFRIQTFSRDGVFLRSFGAPGIGAGLLYRPKGLALDTEGNIYIADGMLETVQAFDRDGRLLYFFGRSGARPGEFQLPAGLFIDARNRIYVADSMNRRVQVFQFRSPPVTARGGAQ